MHLVRTLTDAESRSAAFRVVPLRTSIGDGLKFGCGFFLGVVALMLIAFVLATVLVAAARLTGTSIPWPPR